MTGFNVRERRDNMKKEYIKPTIEVVELRMEERLASCTWWHSHGFSGCTETENTDVSSS